MSYLPVANPTKSFWHSEPSDIHDYRSTPDLPIETDIVIVGSGYAGTTTAYYLLKDNPEPPKILMLEARSVCSGATGRNGGHLKPDTYRQYLDFVKKYGARGAAEIVNFETSHIPAMAKLINEEGIECDFVVTRACDVDVDPIQQEKSLKGYTAMQKNPYVNNREDIQIVYGENAKTISKSEAARFCITYTAGQMWPYKLITGILKKLLDKGLNLQTNTPVLKTEKLPNGKFLVKTSRGDVICSKLVLCTNAYTKAIAPEFDGKITPIKGLCSHIVSADPKKRTPHLTNTYGIRYAGSETDYLINRPDGSVIVGGAKKYIFPFPEKFFNVVDDSFIIENTDKYFNNYMENFYYTWKDFKTKVSSVWSGILGYSDDTLPYVGESVTEKDKYILAGFHGHGMPRVLLCAKAIAECIREGKNIQDTAIPDSFKLTAERMANKDDLLQTTITSSATKAKL